MSQHTPLFDAHTGANARMVDFAGWQLPVHYGSLIEEHHAVRKHSGLFDVSHMTTIDVQGDGARDWLRTLLANDVAKLKPGAALYSCLCREDGGVLDDLIATCISEQHYRLVVNAATRQKDLDWFEQHKRADVQLTVLDNTAMIAVQGPESVALADRLLSERLGDAADLSGMSRFRALMIGDWFIARTGYTGEDGVEITLPASEAMSFWQSLVEAGVRPAGLGARDTLRLEAGMALYGNDLEEAYSPVAAGLAWTIDLNDESREFIGREVLEDHALFGCGWYRVGLMLEGRGVLRAGQTVQLVGRDVGVVTSGTFSPTLERSIAMARVDNLFKGSCDVIIRDRPFVARVVPLPFVKHGMASF